MFRFKNGYDEEDTLRSMSLHGGGFVKGLAELYRHADATNKLKLLDAFGHYFSHYFTGNTSLLEEGFEPETWFKISMNKVDKGHHIALDGHGTQEELEHAITHLLIDQHNKMGIAMRKVMQLGVPLTEEEAKKLLGNDVVEHIKYKAEKAQEEVEPKLPN